MADASEPLVVSWSVVWVTLIVSAAVGIVFYAFFSRVSRNHAKHQDYGIYETRQFNYAHRSPPPFASQDKCCGWAIEAYKMSDDETLRFVGLDSFMFVRFLRLMARTAAVGTLLGCAILIPIYATGGASGPETEEWNSITLAHVEQGSSRLWASAVVWLLFVCFFVSELYTEWRLYAPRRYDFLAHGDPDTDRDYRYTVMVENIPPLLRSNHKLRENMERLFPDKVRQVSVLLKADNLEDLIAERQKSIEACEKAVAFTHAKPDKPAPQVKVGGTMCCGMLGGQKVDAIPHYEDEIGRLNGEIDKERASLNSYADSAHEHATEGPSGSSFLGSKLLQSFSKKKESTKDNEAGDDAVQETDNKAVQETDSKAVSTAFVTFTSLRAKQAAVQCEISGKVDDMDVAAAPIPAGVIWKNALVPKTAQRYTSMLASLVWTVGVLFWAVPVTFVTGIANLNSLVTSFGAQPLNTESFWYGLISGLLPVIMLQLLMLILYFAIVACATYWIRCKSMPEVDGYTFFWHQLYQFANLWLILIGGSAFNQIDAIIKDPGSIARLLASAIPGASTFFLNMVIMGSFLLQGVELSCIAAYGVKLIMGMLQPEAMKTQRMLDDEKKPQSIQWGRILPPMVFIVLVALIYMPIVPLMEPFAFAYFGGWYLVWKHQCLHVYVQEFEGGGILWETLFGFIMACLYTAEIVVIAYLGLKEGTGPAIFSIVPLVGTILVHYLLRRNIAGPLKNLSLEVAADVDLKDGELPKSTEDEGPNAVAIENQLYGQPCLKASADKREPMPYRRSKQDEENVAPEPKAAFTSSTDAAYVVPEMPSGENGGSSDGGSSPVKPVDANEATSATF